MLFYSPFSSLLRSSIRSLLCNHYICFPHLRRTVVPVASNEILVGTATVTKGAAAKTIDGAKVSMGSSGLIIGNSTVPLPTAATSTASLGGLIMSGLGPGPSSSQTSSSSSTATGAATGDGARVGRGGRLSWIVTFCTGSLLLLCQ